MPRIKWRQSSKILIGFASRKSKFIKNRSDGKYKFNERFFGLVAGGDKLKYLR